MRCGTAEAKEDGVSRLHGDEGTEGVIDCAIDKSGNEAARKKENVGVCRANLGAQVGLGALKEGPWRFGDFWLL